MSQMIRTSKVARALRHVTLGLAGVALCGSLTLAAAAAGPDTLGVKVTSGNAANGKAIYNKVCIACHGDRAQGNELLNAPRLVGQEPWYLARQLKYFKDGIRGADPKDVYGAQMRPMALTLQGDQDIADIVAFITSLGKSP